jgi:hypothetical protein
MLNSLKSAFAKLLSKPAASEESRQKPLEYELNLPDKRNGKIAHLPRPLRDRICQRIYENASLTQLAEALNQIPEVQAVLANHFNAKPISQQNLSEWKAGGYRDWLLKRQLLENKTESVADARQLAQTAHGLADSLFGILTLDYAQLMMNRDQDDDETFEKKRAALSILSQDIVRLRRCQIQARRVEIQEGRFERDEEKTQEQVLHKFAEWASHPDIRRIFILEPLNHMRLLREKYSLPPTKEDLLLLQELQKDYNYPKSTLPPNPQTNHKPSPTEKCEPDPAPVKPPAPAESPKPNVAASRQNAAEASPLAPTGGEPGPARRSQAEAGEGELNSNLKTQNSTLPSSSTVSPVSPIKPTSPASEDTPMPPGHSPAPIQAKAGELNSKLKTQNSSLTPCHGYHPSKISTAPPPPRRPLDEYDKAILAGKTHWEALEAMPKATPRPQSPHPLFNPPPVERKPSTCYGPCPPPWADYTHVTSKVRCG